MTDGVFEGGNLRRPDAAMPYRPEIDGLRAVAVVAVALFHAGFALFGGGFVGVDVFFVISGYLITAILVHELEAGGFDALRFYERRARRLLPALFLVMAASTVLACLWMLPGDLERFGKSLIATSLFSNNVLLFRTSGYWSLPSEFKPLLHTWSLAVEEQYYVAFPLALAVGWALLGRRVWYVLLAGAVASLAAAQWAATREPVAGFYLLPTRVWEFLVGSFAAQVLRSGRAGAVGIAYRGALSGLGLLAVAASVVWFGRANSAPGLHTLVPVGGTALILVFAADGTLVFRLLTHRVTVGLGLISYSLYLWHVPAFAFARIYAVDRPSPYLLGALFVGTIPLSYLSWRFVELPVRSGAMLGRRSVVIGSLALSCAFVAGGSYLVWTGGAPGRLYADDGSSRDAIGIRYNERGFAFRKNAFGHDDRLRVLVVGNSFARDFINMTMETFDLSRVEIVYRDEPGGCIAAWSDPDLRSLLEQARIIVLASRSFLQECVAGNVAFAHAQGKELFYIGSKHFGANLNWIARLPPAERCDRFNPLLAPMIREEAAMAETIPKENYISLLAPVVRDGAIPITDGEGRLLTPDRTHLTRYGARYFGAKALFESPYGRMLRSE